MAQRNDAKTRRIFDEGGFDNPTRKGVQAVSYNGVKFDYPYYFDEWLEYSFKLWDELHEVSEGRKKPDWNSLRFRDESDYFCNSFQTAIPIWLLAINEIHSEKLKYQAYTRIFNGVDLFETNDFVPPSKPRKNNNSTKVCTVPVKHLEHTQKLSALGSKTCTKLCGTSIYPVCRAIRIVENGEPKQAIFKNSASVTEHFEFILEMHLFSNLLFLEIIPLV